MQFCREKKPFRREGSEEKGQTGVDRKATGTGLTLQLCTAGGEVKLHPYKIQQSFFFKVQSDHYISV